MSILARENRAFTTRMGVISIPVPQCLSRRPERCYVSIGPGGEQKPMAAITFAPGAKSGKTLRGQRGTSDGECAPEGTPGPADFQSEWTRAILRIPSTVEGSVTGQ